MTFKKTAETLPHGAHTLERDYYVSPDILQKEYENIFLNNWICAGRLSELSKPGQYKVINIPMSAVIVAHGSAKKYQASFQNPSSVDTMAGPMG